MKISDKNSLRLSYCLIFILGLFCIDSGHDWSDDFALYVEQCQAMYDGSMQELYRANRFAMEHSYDHTGPYWYPNGFPMLLLPVYAIFGLNLWVFKFYCWCFFVAALPLLYKILTQENVDDKIALLITLLVGFNYHFIRYADAVLSDLPFFFFSLLSIYSIQKQAYRKLASSIGLGVLLYFTYSIRDIGILLLGFLFVAQGLFFYKKTSSKQTKDRYFALLPYLIFILLKLGMSFLTPTSGSKHLDMFAHTSFETLFANVQYYCLLIGNYFVLFRGVPIYIQWLVVAVFSGLFLLGMFQQIRTKSPWLAYVSMTFGLYFVWVAVMGMRFLFPILPFIVYYIIMGIKAIVQQKKWQQWIGTTLLVTTILQGLLVAYFYSNKDTNEAYSTEMQAIYNYIKKEVPKEAIIVFYKPRALRLFTGRNSVQKKIEQAEYALVPTAEAPTTFLFQTTTYTLIHL